MEQILSWDPEVIVTIDVAFMEAVRADSRWRGVRTVRGGRVYRAPLLPFPWIDFPPSANRLIGLASLGQLFYPRQFTEDLRKEARGFYAKFYHRAPDDRQLGVVYAIGAALRRHDPVLVLVLGGIVVGTLLGAGVSLMKYLADLYNQLPAITFWLLGSLASMTPGDTMAVLAGVVLGLTPLFMLRWRLNILTLAEEEAQSLGVDTRRLRLVVIAAATLMTAVCVAVSAVIGWIGLVIPHIARLLVGPDFGRLLPIAMLLGGAYLLGVDTIARTLAAIEIPIGVLTAFLGAPFFLWLLASSRRGWR